MTRTLKAYEIAGEIIAAIIILVGFPYCLLWLGFILEIK